MKKIIFLVVFILGSIFSASNTFATDACNNFLPRKVSFLGQTTMEARLRSFPCTYKSTVYGASKTGVKYEVIAQVDGWYQIKTSNGNTYWIWDKAIKNIGNISASNISNGYTFTQKEKYLIFRIVSKVQIIIDNKGIKYKNFIGDKIEVLIAKSPKTSKRYFLFTELLNRIKALEKKEIIINKPIETPKKVENNSAPKKIKKTPAPEVKKVETQKSQNTTTNNLSNYTIDMAKVRKTWLNRYNGARADLGKYPYSYDSRLDATALDWSKTAKIRGNITHKRNAGDSYYDYNKITSWFSDRGVVCKNINRVTHTENIGWGTFSCSDGECSDELLGGIRKTFNYYMSEKNKTGYYERAHYRSIMNDYFKKIGIGIELDKTSNNYYKYYLTIHYCTEVLD